MKPWAHRRLLLIQSLTFGSIFKHLLGNNPNNAIMFAGVLLACAAAAMMWIKEPPIVRDVDALSAMPSAGVTERKGATAYAEMSRRADAKNVATLGGNPRSGQVLGRGADVIVVGARQDRSVADRLLGTVGSDIARRAHCDVVIVRPAEEHGDLVVPEDPPGTS